jgi:hypothetical protein
LLYNYFMQHTNRLVTETSPYLLQHAHNPVDWYPWGEEALAKARQEDKPILVSIGYSSCHWCHVMERESFEDADTARLMNTHFINIKIDREERPDLDHIYMDAVQAMTGSGGWPLNVFLTPSLKPFYGERIFRPLRFTTGLPGKMCLCVARPSRKTGRCRATGLRTGGATCSMPIRLVKATPALKIFLLTQPGLNCCWITC